MTSGPIAYSIDRANQRVTVVVSGQPTLMDVSTSLDRLCADTDFHAGDDFLWDRRAVRDLPTGTFVENVARLLREHEGRLGAGRVALIVSAHSPAHFGMGRMLEILSERGARFQVFRELNQAIAWLDEGRALKPEKKL